MKVFDFHDIFWIRSASLNLLEVRRSLVSCVIVSWHKVGMSVDVVVISPLFLEVVHHFFNDVLSQFLSRKYLNLSKARCESLFTEKPLIDRMINILVSSTY